VFTNTNPMWLHLRFSLRTLLHKSSYFLFSYLQYTFRLRSSQNQLISTHPYISIYIYSIFHPKPLLSSLSSFHSFTSSSWPGYDVCSHKQLQNNISSCLQLNCIFKSHQINPLKTKLHLCYSLNYLLRLIPSVTIAMYMSVQISARSCIYN